MHLGVMVLKANGGSRHGELPHPCPPFSGLGHVRASVEIGTPSSKREGGVLSKSLEVPISTS